MENARPIRDEASAPRQQLADEDFGAAGDWTEGGPQMTRRQFALLAAWWPCLLVLVPAGVVLGSMLTGGPYAP